MDCYQVQQYSDVQTYIQTIRSFLLAHEMENILLFSILNSLSANPHRYGEADPRMLVIRQETIKLIALQTPPHNIILSHTEDLAAIHHLAAFLSEANVALPGVLGFSEGVETFIAHYQHSHDRQPCLDMKERAHQLVTVNPRYLDTYRVISARKDHVSQILDWIDGFKREAFPNQKMSPMTEKEIKHYRKKITDQRIYVCENEGKIVSMANLAGETPHGQSINMVYTPPEYRKHGYASACVAELSRHILKTGHQYACLFTDIANPTSNHIYHEIGYRPICDFIQYKYTENTG